VTGAGSFSVPPGNPVALRAAAARLRTAAGASDSLSGDTDTLTRSVISNGEWSGSASEAFGGFGGNLGQGAGALQQPLSDIASAVDDYADALEDAQQKAQLAITTSLAADIDSTGSVFGPAEQAALSARDALTTLEQTAQQAAQKVTQASGGLQLDQLFGQNGQVTSWVGSQPALDEHFLWAQGDIPVEPEPWFAPGTGDIPVEPEPWYTPGTGDIPVEPGPGPEIGDIPIGPGLGIGTEPFPPTVLGPLKNYDTTEPEDGGAGGGGGDDGGGQDPKEIGEGIGEDTKGIQQGKRDNIATKVNEEGLDQDDAAIATDAAAAKAFGQTGGIWSAPNGNLVFLPKYLSQGTWFEVTPQGRVMPMRGTIAYGGSPDLDLSTLTPAP
jgi:uncharacterized protein YukE